jgi:hypothetical protein
MWAMLAGALLAVGTAVTGAARAGDGPDRPVARSRLAPVVMKFAGQFSEAMGYREADSMPGS